MQLCFSHEQINFQPYRTTPLVLPGAKIKKDAPLGECYLRHHPNPMIRAAPHHYEPAHPEVAMKQKVRFLEIAGFTERGKAKTRFTRGKGQSFLKPSGNRKN